MAQTCYKSLNQDARMLKPWLITLIWKVNLWVNFPSKVTSRGGNLTHAEFLSSVTSNHF